MNYQSRIFTQALPMVTIVVGKKNNTDKCRLITTNPNVASSPKVEFPVPSDTNPLTIGEPVWANYVKGIVQYFDGICHLVRNVRLSSFRDHYHEFMLVN